MAREAENCAFMDPYAYIAATGGGEEEEIESYKLEAYLQLDCVTPGKKNTLLHLAAAAGNLELVDRILGRENLQCEFIEAKNINGNTALHEAAQRGHKAVVDALLTRHKELAAIRNGLKQTALFKACESGDVPTVESLVQAESSTFDVRSLDSEGGRTVLHVAAICRDASLLQYLIKAFGGEKTLVEKADNDGNTVLHWAVKRNRVDMVELLLKSHRGLCFLRNNKKKETPLCMAVRLGCFNIVKELIKWSPGSIEIRSEYDKNVLHLAVEFRRVEIVKYLTENVDLSQLINEPTEYERSTTDGKEDERPSAQGKDPLESRGNTPLHIAATIKNSTLINEPTEYERSTTDGKEDERPSAQGKDPLESGGNTPLHIAETIKNSTIVKLLLNVDGVKKGAVNKAGLTPLDIARGNTEYHESFKIIERLGDYPEGCRPFLYSAPTVSSEKHEKALKNLNDVFSQRRDTELVVAVLLATMAFTAAFTVPGGFRSEADPPHAMGSPLLIGYTSFKLFLIFDCVAFFVALFVSLMWTISSPLATDDPMLFMTITAPVLCLSFAFMAYAFMLAVYAVVAVSTLAWVILASSVFIYLLGNVAFFHQMGKAVVRRARFHRLCGVACVLDDIVENIWIRAERGGFLYFVRSFDEKFTELLSGHHDHKKK